jgi:hypothetical protein
MFLIRYCTESAKDPLQGATNTSFDGMSRPLRNDYLTAVQSEHYYSDLVRTRREDWEKESFSNGTAYEKDDANCYVEESISELSPSSVDQYGSSISSSYDDTTGQSDHGEHRSGQKDHSHSSSEFSSPNEFLYSSMQTDGDDSRSRQSMESSRSRNTSGSGEQSTIGSSRRENYSLNRARNHMIRNPKSLLGRRKQSLDYSCSYISEESSEDYEACHPIQEEHYSAVISEEDESYDSQSQPDRNYIKHLYANVREVPTSKGVNPEVASGMSSTEPTVKNLDEAFCMSMTEDGSLREESTLCEDLSDFGLNKSCLPSFGYGRKPDGGYNLLEQHAKNTTPNVERHINFPVSPSPNKSSKELISEYLRAREARKSGAGKNNWLGFRQKQEASTVVQSSVEAPTRISIEKKTTEVVSPDPPSRQTPSSSASKPNLISEYLQARDPKNHNRADDARNLSVGLSQPDQQYHRVDDTTGLYKYQFSRPETPECSIDYANVINEYLQARGGVHSEMGDTKGARPFNLIKSERADVSALSNPSYLVSPNQSKHLEFLRKRTGYPTINETCTSQSSSEESGPNGRSTAEGQNQRENMNRFELQSPSTLTSASMVYRRNDVSPSESEGDGAFAERILGVEKLGNRRATWSEKRSETDSYGYSIRHHDDDDYRDCDAASRNDDYYDEHDDENRPHCTKTCFPGVDRFVCHSKSTGGYATLEDPPPRFLKGKVVTPRTALSPIVTPRTALSPFESPTVQCYGMQFEI